MPIDFPLNPILDQTYSFGDKTWKYNGFAWDSITTTTITQGGSNVTVNELPPTSPTPVEGDLWFESDTTKMYVYYDGYWVEQGSPITTIGNLDGGFPSSDYGGMTLIDAGTV